LAEENSAPIVLISCERFNVRYVVAASKQQLDDKFISIVAKILFCKFFELYAQLKRLFWCNKE